MINILLLALAVSSTFVYFPDFETPQDKKTVIRDNPYIDVLPAIVSAEYAYSKNTLLPINAIRLMLNNEAPTLKPDVISKVLNSLECSKKYRIKRNDVLTIIDYSLPSSEKRLWVFDLKEKKLLFHTYVSHGIKSGTLLTNYFSNINNSKASSLGVYTTEKTYYGRDGLSLRLDGLEKGFNNNASNRYIVMHGGWYVDENFIKKYGRAGRSWGCPAIPQNLTKSIITTIQDKSLFVVYYPSDNWFIKSTFLNCSAFDRNQNLARTGTEINPLVQDKDNREAILFADLNNNNKREENEPILAITADNYQRIFHTKAPLERMLRRQINNLEYIALSQMEFKNIASNNRQLLNSNTDISTAVYFVIPVVKMQRGYYATEMQIINIGKVKDVVFPNPEQALEPGKALTVNFEEKRPVNLRSTNQFIRWLGL